MGKSSYISLVLYLTIFTRCYAIVFTQNEINSTNYTNNSITITINEETINKTSPIIYEEKNNLDDTKINIDVINTLNETGSEFLYYLQIHSLFIKLTLNNENNWENRTGTNIGFVFDFQESTNFTIDSNDNSTTIEFMVVLLVYRKSETPFSENCTNWNPNFNVSVSDSVISVTTEPLNCAQETSSINYEYRYLYITKGDYSSESYFNAIRQLLSGELALDDNNKIHTKENPNNPLLRTYNRYAGTGLFFTAVIKNNHSKPIGFVVGQSYGCLEDNVVPDCDILDNRIPIVLSCLLVWFGVLSLIIGRGGMEIRIIVYTIVIGQFISYAFTAPLGLNYVYTIVCGLFMTLTLIVFSFNLKKDGRIIFCDLCAGAILGYIFISFIIFHLADNDFFSSSAAYHLTIFLSMVITAIFYCATAASCGVVINLKVMSVTLIIVGLIFCTFGNWRYAFVFNWRRIADQDFKYALCFPHLLIRDWILLVSWIILIFFNGCGFIFHCCGDYAYIHDASTFRLLRRSRA